MINNITRLVKVIILKAKREILDKIIKINQAYCNLTTS